MKESMRSPFRPQKQEETIDDSSKGTIKTSSIPKTTPVYEEVFDPGDGEEIKEKLAPAFFFNKYRGRRLAIGMKSGDTIIGDIGPQQWQFLQLYNVVVENKEGRKSVKSRMINVNRIEFFDFVDSDENKTGQGI